MNNAISILLDEHSLLLKAIKTAEKIQKIEDNKFYLEVMQGVISCFKTFSEIYHYPKEEKILYPLLVKRSHYMSVEFIHEICDHHEDFKSLMKEIEVAHNTSDLRTLRKVTDEYLTLLEEHIRKENSIILSVAGVLLTEEEAEFILEEFNALDKQHGEKEKLLNMIWKINLQFEEPT